IEIMRINKYLAACGVASRRKSEEYILAGNVKVNGKVTKDLSTQIKPEQDTVKLNDKKIEIEEKTIYIMLNKPKGYLSTVEDDRNRKTVLDLITNQKHRIYPIGRLDYDTQGLLLLTNDGKLANKIMKPESKMPKTYIVKVDGKLTSQDIEKITNGIQLDTGYTTMPSKIDMISNKKNISKFKLTIYEGKNRQIKKMMREIKKQVISLKRIAIGDIKLGDLSDGKYRYLTDIELNYLKNKLK
ncbi:MAG: pseudouridine synthase, partial [archaeon]